MSVIESMEELETAEPGTVFTIGGAQWQRVTEGLSSAGSVLGLQHFTGYVERRLISTAPEAVRVGRWYLAPNGYHWLVVEAALDRVVALGLDVNFAVMGGEWHSGGVPDWTLVEAETRWMLATRALQEAWQDRIPPPLVEALHGYANEADDEDFDNLLQRFDIGRVTEHRIDVEMNGYVDYSPSYDTVRRHFNNDFSIDDIDGAVRVSWSRSVQITKTGVGCQCDTINSDDLYEYYPEDAEDVEWEVSCG